MPLTESQRRKTVQNLFIRSIGHHWKKITAGSLFVVITNVLQVFIPSLIGDVVDTLQGAYSMDAVLRSALVILVLSALAGLTRFCMRYLIIGSSWRIENDIRRKVYAHLLRLPLSYHNRTRTGDIIARLTNDLTAVRMMFGPAVMYSINALVLGPAVLTFMFRADPGLALYAMLPFPLIALMIYFAGRRIHRYFKEVQESYSDISAHVQENLNGIKVIKAYTREKRELKSLDALSRTYVANNKKIINLQSFYHPFLDVLASSGLIILLWLGGIKVARGETSLGVIVTFVMYIGMLVWPSIALGWVVAIFQRGTASLGRISEILDEPPERSSEENEPIPLKGHIEASDLTFGYSPDETALDGISFSIDPGETLAIVGRTGSGKSTLLGVLSGVFDIPKGMVRYDGTDIVDLPLDRLRSSISLVPQETFLFSESVAENISFGKSESTNDDIRRAAALAEIADDILQYPDGFDTLLGERGLTVSGGQRQRLAIARALVSEAPILFFDDCLSNVDTVTEMKILSNIKSVVRERTAVIVTHRLAAISDADLILYLDNGRIIEKGTHSELMRLDGDYAALYNEQESLEHLEGPQ